MAGIRAKRFVYPVDTDQFEQIRKDGKVYIDKTDMVYDLVNVQKYKYVFLSRPRRFGKSLLCNTFKAYFQGQKELFEACPEQGRKALRIMELETEWKQYPVLHFIMSGLKNLSVPLAQSKLGGFLRDYEKIYGREEADESPGARFFVLELKVDDTVENALAQIDAKGYAIPYEAEGRRLTKCGVTISSDQRNITHWRSVDAEGNLIDEQTF